MNLFDAHILCEAICFGLTLIALSRFESQLRRLVAAVIAAKRRQDVFDAKIEKLKTNIVSITNYQRKRRR